MPFKIVRNDITRVKADVIVNTANPNPICASGTDLAIYEAAGKEKLLAERANIGKIARGDIAVTGAYSLNAKYIIHLIFLCDEIALPEIWKSDVRKVEIILCEFTRVMFYLSHIPRALRCHVQHQCW